MACFSNWYPAGFSCGGATFPTAEHFIMHRKARLFKDVGSAEAILAAPTPAEAQRLAYSRWAVEDDRLRHRKFPGVFEAEEPWQTPLARRFDRDRAPATTVAADRHRGVRGYGSHEAPPRWLSPE